MRETGAMLFENVIDSKGMGDNTARQISTKAS